VNGLEALYLRAEEEPTEAEIRNVQREHKLASRDGIGLTWEEKTSNQGFLPN